MSLNQQAKKGVTILIRVIDPNYPGKIGLLLHSGGKEEYVYNTGDPLGHLWYPRMLWSNQKLQQSNSGQLMAGFFRNPHLAHLTRQRTTTS